MSSIPYATENQRAYIVALARAKGMTLTAAMLDYGFAAGHTLLSHEASELIDSLKGLSVAGSEAARAAWKATNAKPAASAKPAPNKTGLLGKAVRVACWKGDTKGLAGTVISDAGKVRVQFSDGSKGFYSRDTITVVEG